MLPSRLATPRQLRERRAGTCIFSSSALIETPYSSGARAPKPCSRSRHGVAAHLQLRGATKRGSRRAAAAPTGDQYPLPPHRKRAWSLPKVERERPTGAEARLAVPGGNQGEPRGRACAHPPGSRARRGLFMPGGGRLYRRRDPAPAARPRPAPPLPGPVGCGDTPLARALLRRAPPAPAGAPGSAQAAHGRRPPEPPPVAQALFGVRRGGTSGAPAAV